LLKLCKTILLKLRYLTLITIFIIVDTVRAYLFKSFELDSARSPFCLFLFYHHLGFNVNLNADIRIAKQFTLLVFVLELEHLKKYVDVFLQLLNSFLLILQLNLGVLLALATKLRSQSF